MSGNLLHSRHCHVQDLVVSCHLVALGVRDDELEVSRASIAGPIAADEDDVDFGRSPIVRDQVADGTAGCVCGQDILRGGLDGDSGSIRADAVRVLYRRSEFENERFDGSTGKAEGFVWRDDSEEEDNKYRTKTKGNHVGQQREHNLFDIGSDLCLFQGKMEAKLQKWNIGGLVVCRKQFKSKTGARLR